MSLLKKISDTLKNDENWIEIKIFGNKEKKDDFSRDDEEGRK